MAERNESQGADEQYQPRSRRERRERETWTTRRGARAAREGNGSRVLGRHARPEATDNSTTAGQDGDTAYGRHSRRKQSILGRHAAAQSAAADPLASTEFPNANSRTGAAPRYTGSRVQPDRQSNVRPKPSPDPLPPTQPDPEPEPSPSSGWTDNEHTVDTTDWLDEETEQRDREIRQELAPVEAPPVEVASSKWLNSLKEEQAKDDSAPQTGIIDTMPLKLKGDIKNSYLGYSSLNNSATGNNNAANAQAAGGASGAGANTAQDEAEQRDSAPVDDPDATVVMKPIKRAPAVRKPVSRDTRSISLTQRVKKEDTAQMNAVPGDDIDPKYLAPPAQEEYEEPEEKGKKSKKKFDLSFREAREQGRVGQWAWSLVREVLVVAIIGLILAFVIKTFVVRGFYIPSGSMENTLQVDDRVFINAAGSYFSDPDRGDVVVFKDSQGWIPNKKQSNFFVDTLTFIGVLPDSSSNYLVKRVIGKPGDRVESDGQGKIRVNGTEITEPYLHPGSNPSDVPFSVEVPEGSYFVMGDHRDNSADSRYHIGDGRAFIKRGDIQGTVFIVALPLNHFGTVDNHSNVFSSVPSSGK